MLFLKKYPRLIGQQIIQNWPENENIKIMKKKPLDILTTNNRQIEHVTIHNNIFSQFSHNKNSYLKRT